MWLWRSKGRDGVSVSHRKCLDQEGMEGLGVWGRGLPEAGEVDTRRMGPGVRLVQALEIQDWAGGLQVGGQGFLGEEETREGLKASGGTQGAGNPGTGLLERWGPGLREERP